MLGCIMLFSHLLFRTINVENKRSMDRIIDEFTKNKTLLYYANFFFDDTEYE